MNTEDSFPYNVPALMIQYKKQQQQQQQKQWRESYSHKFFLLHLSWSHNLGFALKFPVAH